MKKDLAPLERTLEVKFTNEALLRQALIHRSYLNEHRDCSFEHNERLEFLGDAVLELVVTDFLYHRFDNPEGELTNWRSSLVNGRMISRICRRLGVDDFLYLSKGEAKDTGKARDYILANAFESIIGAMYLDQGYSVTRDFILRVLIPELDTIFEKKLYIDAKSQFQELSQAKTGVTPSYRVLEESGPDHQKHFRVGVYIQDELVAEGSGSNKQTAQQDAAENALLAKGWQ